MRVLIHSVSRERGRAREAEMRNCECGLSSPGFFSCNLSTVRSEREKTCAATLYEVDHIKERFYMAD